jgi:hypothetical protein
MKRFAMVVQSSPVAEREDEYNNWYENQHLPDILRVPGFKSAQRFVLAQDDKCAVSKYMAIYEFETDNLAETMATLQARSGTEDMVLSEAMDRQSMSFALWMAVSEKLTAGD